MKRKTKRRKWIGAKAKSKQKKPLFSTKNLTLLFLFGFALGLFITYLMNTENVWLSKSKYPFGIDISHYQGNINWEELHQSKHKVEFIFIRATMGKNGKDQEFAYNWQNAKKYGYLRGAYHYYRPNENWKAQAENFMATVHLDSNDLMPVLDIEEVALQGDVFLREGVLNWLKTIEAHYGIRPMVYTGQDFYKTKLQGHIDDYPLWIAAYSGSKKLKGIDWKFHQFTDRIRIKGTSEKVDGNFYNH